MSTNRFLLKMVKNAGKMALGATAAATAGKIVWSNIKPGTQEKPFFPTANTFPLKKLANPSSATSNLLNKDEEKLKLSLSCDHNLLGINMLQQSIIAASVAKLIAADNLFRSALQWNPNNEYAKRNRAVIGCLIPLFPDYVFSSIPDIDVNKGQSVDLVGPFLKCLPYKDPANKEVVARLKDLENSKDYERFFIPDDYKTSEKYNVTSRCP